MLRLLGGSRSERSLLRRLLLRHHSCCSIAISCDRGPVVYSTSPFRPGNDVGWQAGAVLRTPDPMPQKQYFLERDQVASPASWNQLVGSASVVGFLECPE